MLSRQLTSHQELYEPLWEDLVKSLNQRGVGVRSIWMADVAWQGQSGILNDDLLGNDRTASLPPALPLPPALSLPHHNH